MKDKMQAQVNAIVILLFTSVLMFYRFQLHRPSSMGVRVVAFLFLVGLLLSNAALHAWGLLDDVILRDNRLVAIYKDVSDELVVGQWLTPLTNKRSKSIWTEQWFKRRSNEAGIS